MSSSCPEPTFFGYAVFGVLCLAPVIGLAANSYRNKLKERKDRLALKYQSLETRLFELIDALELGTSRWAFLKLCINAIMPLVQYATYTVLLITNMGAGDCSPWAQSLERFGQIMRYVFVVKFTIFDLPLLVYILFCTSRLAQGTVVYAMNGLAAYAIMFAVGTERPFVPRSDGLGFFPGLLLWLLDCVNAAGLFCNFLLVVDSFQSVIASYSLYLSFLYSLVCVATNGFQLISTVQEGRWCAAKAWISEATEYNAEKQTVASVKQHRAAAALQRASSDLSMLSSLDERLLPEANDGNATTITSSVRDINNTINSGNINASTTDVAAGENVLTPVNDDAQDPADNQDAANYSPSSHVANALPPDAQRIFDLYTFAMTFSGYEAIGGGRLLWTRFVGISTMLYFAVTFVGFIEIVKAGVEGESKETIGLAGILLMGLYFLFGLCISRRAVFFDLKRKKLVVVRVHALFPVIQWERTELDPSHVSVPAVNRNGPYLCCSCRWGTHFLHFDYTRTELQPGLFRCCCDKVECNSLCCCRCCCINVSSDDFTVRLWDIPDDDTDGESERVQGKFRDVLFMFAAGRLPTEAEVDALNSGAMPFPPTVTDPDDDDGGTASGLMGGTTLLADQGEATTTQTTTHISGAPNDATTSTTAAETPYAACCVVTKPWPHTALFSLVFSTIFLVLLIVGVASPQLGVRGASITRSNTLGFFLLPKEIPVSSYPTGVVPFLRAGAVFGIMSVVAQLLVTIILGVQYYNKPKLLSWQCIRKIPGNAFYVMIGFLIFQLITWCMTVGSLNAYCKVFELDFGIETCELTVDYGFIILVVTWCLSLFLTIFYRVQGLHSEDLMTPIITDQDDEHNAGGADDATDDAPTSSSYQPPSPDVVDNDTTAATTTAAPLSVVAATMDVAPSSGVATAAAAHHEEEVEKQQQATAVANTSMPSTTAPQQHNHTEATEPPPQSPEQNPIATAAAAAHFDDAEVEAAPRATAVTDTQSTSAAATPQQQNHTEATEPPAAPEQNSVADQVAADNGPPLTTAEPQTSEGTTSSSAEASQSQPPPATADSTTGSSPQQTMVQLDGEPRP